MAMSPKNILLIGGAIVVVVAIVLAAKSATEAKRLKAEITTLQQQAQQQGQASPEEVKKLVEEVGKLIVLPEGEDPTVATITDKEKLKDVAFFDKAENEDKVLIYVTARKAYLYRPSTQKIIEVATLNLNTASQEFTGKVALRNGTAIAGLTTQLETALKQRMPKVEITGKDNAKQTTYTETLVIDLTGSKKEDAQRLATLVGGKVASLPEGEATPEGADFLIIIGGKVASPTASPATSPTSSPAP